MSEEMQTRKRETEDEIVQMQKQFAQNKDDVIKMILGHVNTVNLS